MEIKKMKNRFIRHVLILLLCGLCHTAVFAHGYNRDAQSKSWGYQPVYTTSATLPSYQFRSTSVYLTSSRHTGSYVPAQHYGPRRMRLSDPFEEDPDDETTDEIGVVHPDRDEMPVGDIPWLLMLLLASGYVTFRSLKRRKA